MGPLAGLRVVEFAGLGPGPFAAMLLADLGAEVVRIERPGAVELLPLARDMLLRGRAARVALDLKTAEGQAAAFALAARADALIEGFRPGVMERLGLGPGPLLAANPGLAYGRMTGWGQDGPLADRAGHDITYIALSGALDAIGEAGRGPVPPLNLLGDFGGGAMYLVTGILAARLSGQGQVIDAAITEGTAHLSTMLYSLRAGGLWPGGRGENILDGGMPYYRCYACACGDWVAVGAIEPQFYAALLAGLDLTDDPRFARQQDRAAWPAMAEGFAAAFAARTRDDWADRFAGTDACVAPVLSADEAAAHPQAAARGIFAAPMGVPEPVPAPRFSATPATLRPEAGPERSAEAILSDWEDRP
ncbi:MAG: CaiB/BaiF CoA-transferase family protein [Pseudomonadota bacterium]